jgi:hypothetical protein
MANSVRVRGHTGTWTVHPATDARLRCGSSMDVNLIKPVPVVQPAHKVKRGRRDRDPGRERSEQEDANRDDKDNDRKRIDTYA